MRVINFASKKELLFIAVLTLIFSIGINEANLSYIKLKNPTNENVNSASASTVYGYTVWSIDNSWYLPQIKNFLNGDGFNLEPKNPEMAVRRTPVYSLFYGAHYLLFGEQYSFFFIRYTQILINLLAVFLLGQAVFNISRNKFFAVLTTVLYALNPFTTAYLYTTITEGISPAFVIFVFYTFSLCLNKFNIKHCIFLGLTLGVAVLLRPSTGVVMPFIFIGLMSQFKVNFENWRNYAFIIAAFASVLLPWTIRNYVVTNGDFVPLEKYYYGDPMDLGRGHIAFRYWISSWDNPANTSPELYSNSVRVALFTGKKLDDVKNEFLAKIPDYVYAINSKQEISDSLDTLNACFSEKHSVYKENPDLTRRQAFETFVCEEQVRNSFDKLNIAFRQQSPLRYYILSPLNFVKSGIFISNTSPYAMVNPPDKNFSFLQKAFKGIAYLLNVCLFLSIIPFLSAARRNGATVILIVGSLLSTFVMLIFFLKHMEGRYFIPLFPLLYVSLAFALTKIYYYLTAKDKFVV